MVVVKAILIFFLILFTLSRLAALESNKDNKLELIYILETILSIVGTILLFKI